MNTCNNCSDSFNGGVEGLVVTANGKLSAAVCPLCIKDVKVGKLVLRKGDLGPLMYDQWAPAEMVGGMSRKA